MKAEQLELDFTATPAPTPVVKQPLTNKTDWPQAREMGYSFWEYNQFRDKLSEELKAQRLANLNFKPVDLGEGVTYQLDDYWPEQEIATTVGKGKKAKVEKWTMPPRYSFSFRDSTKSVVSESGYYSDHQHSIPTLEELKAHFEKRKAAFKKEINARKRAEERIKKQLAAHKAKQPKKGGAS